MFLSGDHAFRRVRLPAGVGGCLYLHAMPGRFESFEKFLLEAHRHGLQLLVCMASDEEVRFGSPSYFEARSGGSLPFSVKSFPMEDLNAPSNRAERSEFKKLVRDVAADLRAGKSVLIHCRMGIGRTGTTAVCVLVELGVEVAEAIRLVGAAGSRPQVPAQDELIRWYVSNPRSGA